MISLRESELRRAIRKGDSDTVERILHDERWASYEEVEQIFREESRGSVRLFHIEYDDLEIRNRFGRPEVRRSTW